MLQRVFVSLSFVGLFSHALFGFDIAAPTPSLQIQSRFIATEIPAKIFTIPLARLGFSGTFVDKNIRYGLLVDFAGDKPALQDAFADYSPIPNWLNIRAGRFRTPFSTQFLASDAQLQFIELSTLKNEFGAQRDIGLMLHNDDKNWLLWALGVFGENEQTEIARLGYQFGYVNLQDQFDFDRGPVRFLLAGSGKLVHSIVGSAASAFEASALVKYQGISANVAFDANLDWAKIDSPVNNKLGWHAQAGYLVNSFVHPAIRYVGTWDKKHGFPLMHHEIVGALTFFWLGRTLELQIETGAHRTVDALNRGWLPLIRAQFQLVI